MGRKEELCTPLKGFFPKKSTGWMPVPAAVVLLYCQEILWDNGRSFAEIWEKLTPMARIGIILLRYLRQPC
jgi:hypothetical protein